jgi:hypothetical protein
VEGIRKNTWLALAVLLGFALIAVVLWRAGGSSGTPDQYGGTFIPPAQTAVYPSPAGMTSRTAPAPTHTAVSNTEPEDGGNDGGQDG